MRQTLRRWQTVAYLKLLRLRIRLGLPPAWIREAIVLGIIKRRIAAAKRRRQVGALLVILLVGVGIGPADADDGGFWDWLQKQSGPKFVGVGTEWHLACVDTDHQLVNCEPLFGLHTQGIHADRIKHELGLWTGQYWSQGNLFADVVDRRILQSTRLVLLYHYQILPEVKVGAGAGVQLMYGPGVAAFGVPVLTLGSMAISPPRRVVGRWLSGLQVGFQESYLGGHLSGARYGNATTTYDIHGEFNAGWTLGYDLRKVLWP